MARSVSSSMDRTPMTTVAPPVPPVTSPWDLVDSSKKRHSRSWTPPVAPKKARTGQAVRSGFWGDHNRQRWRRRWMRRWRRCCHCYSKNSNQLSQKHNSLLLEQVTSILPSILHSIHSNKTLCLTYDIPLTSDIQHTIVLCKVIYS